MAAEQESAIHDNPALGRFLDEVSAHMGRRPGKRDMMLELRSAILDRAEEIGDGDVNEESLARALEAVGEPALVASAYTKERYLIGPRLYRPFLFYTAIVFAVHLVMILVASVALTRIEVFPVTILRVEPPYTLLSLFLSTVHALLLDVGLMVVIFTSLGRARGSVHLPQFTFRVGRTPRQALARILLAVLVLVILNLFRERLFVVVAPAPENPAATVGYSLINQRFTDVLPLVNGFLVLAMLVQLAYLFLGETRASLTGDAAVSFLGVGLMIALLAGPAFISFPAAANTVSGAVPALNQLLGKAVKLILIMFAVALAVGGVKRLLRLGQLWR